MRSMEVPFCSAKQENWPRRLDVGVDTACAVIGDLSYRLRWLPFGQLVA